MLLAVTGLIALIICYTFIALAQRARDLPESAAPLAALPVATLAIASAIAETHRSIAAPRQFITHSPEHIAVWIGLGLPLLGLAVGASTAHRPHDRALLPVLPIAALALAALLAAASRLHLIEGQLLIVATACALWSASLRDHDAPRQASTHRASVHRASVLPIAACMIAAAAGAVLTARVPLILLAAAGCALAGSIALVCTRTAPTMRLRTASMWAITAAGLGLGGAVIAITIVTAASDAPFGGVRAVLAELALRTAARPYITGLRTVTPELAVAAFGAALACRPAPPGRRDPLPAVAIGAVSGVIVLLRLAQLGGRA